MYNDIGQKINAYFPKTPSIMSGLGHTQTGTSNVISVQQGSVRWVNQPNVLSATAQFTWTIIDPVTNLAITCPTSATQKYIVAKATKAAVDTTFISVSGAILPTAYTLAEIAAFASSDEYAPLWTITNTAGVYTIGTDANCAFNYGVNIAADLTLYAKLAANQTFTGVNTFTGATKVPTIAGTTDSSTSAASTAFVQAIAALKAPLASPVLTGTPTVPTAAIGTNTTQAASTAYVQSNTMSLNGSIVAGTNLDAVTTSGVYIQSINANATLALNYPVAYAGELEVYTNGSFTFQRYSTYGPQNKVYTRGYYTTWGSWSELANLSDVTANGGGIVASGSNANGNWVKYSNGLIQQWGIKIVAVNFNPMALPLAFTTVSYSFVATVNNSTQVGYVVEWNVNATSSIGVAVIRTDNNTYASANITWTAIGY